MSHLHSAGPETQAVTHTDGGVKCGVQVFKQTEQISQLKFGVGDYQDIAKVRWEPAEGAEVEPSFQVTVTRFDHFVANLG